MCSRPSSASPTCGIRPSGRSTAARNSTIVASRSCSAADSGRPVSSASRAAPRNSSVDEAVIRHRRFVVGAVRQHLHGHFLLQPLRGTADPMPRPAGRSLNTAATIEQTDDVAEEVVARHFVRVLEVAFDEHAVVEQRLVRPRQNVDGEAWRTIESARGRAPSSPRGWPRPSCRSS